MNQLQLGQYIDALLFATVKHQDQRRKDGVTYLVHPIGVSKILIECGITDIKALQAALLHDTVEDTHTTFEEIETTFGKEVSDIVREVTDDKSLPKITRKKLQVEHAKTCSLGAKYVKYADKIHNLNNLITDIPCAFKPYCIAQGYFVWSCKVVESFKGINPMLDQKFNDVLQGKITDDDGVQRPALPEGDLDILLEKYYQDLATYSK
ncbi:HD domain containing protein, putative [Entamoeba invadens IP1]|uniref:HD domain containing protein, putative n=1 Tax=Entamoeba invadens IP1 TaxID=370355 RepID=UPI0002C3D179|nr:HD domain containing protein, putative [Entamoeba invadens IP1]ELP93092.1 HD domain containing protein, putative [Entamoeba invadens IP1]|eukprot:XP_004259863.1 HD domain containing protein, putative [Entamoeba invadens IP1]